MGINTYLGYFWRKGSGEPRSEKREAESEKRRVRRVRRGERRAESGKARRGKKKAGSIVVIENLYIDDAVNSLIETPK